MICKACGKNRVALVCTADSNTTSNGFIPRPAGGLYLKHAANVIVHVKEQQSNSTTNPSFKASLLKTSIYQNSKICDSIYQENWGNGAFRLMGDI